MLSKDLSLMPDALECITSMDVFVGGESEFSKAAAAMSANVKVLTDQWHVDQDESMVTLNPAVTVAGMSSTRQIELQRVVQDWRECDLAFKTRA